MQDRLQDRLQEGRQRIKILKKTITLIFLCNFARNTLHPGKKKVQVLSIPTRTLFAADRLHRRDGIGLLRICRLYSRTLNKG